MAIACAWPALTGHAQTHSGVNFSTNFPAPPAGTSNVTFQNDQAFPIFNLSAYVSYPTYQVNCTAGGDLSTPIATAEATLDPNRGGILDARQCKTANAWNTTAPLNVSNLRILFPCATIGVTQTITIAPGTRNVALIGCNYLGGSGADSTIGGTVLQSTIAGPVILAGDPYFLADTPGFTVKNLTILTTVAPTAAVALQIDRTQDIDLESLLLIGDNATGQTGIELNGQGNYTGGQIDNVKIEGYGTAILGTGSPTGGTNALTLTRMHIVCPTSGGNPLPGSLGLQLVYADGNTMLGGDVEDCATLLELDQRAIGNAFYGVRNEGNSTQITAAAGSGYNRWDSGNTLFTGHVSDLGTRNSFSDTFHRAENSLNGDWYGSQADQTVTDHQRLGIGAGNERGRLTEIQTDFGYRWESGFTDGGTGEQFWNLTDLIQNVPRLSIGQYLSATAQSVVAIIVNDGGCFSDNSPLPTVTLTGGGGTGATATATMYAVPAWSTCYPGYGIATIAVAAAGSGYTSAPTVTVTSTYETAAPNAIAEITPAGSTNDQTAVNAAGTGATVINGSANAGTGGLIIASGGPTPSEVAAVDNLGNLTTYGNLGFYTAGAYQWHWNCASSAVCALHNDAATIPANVFRAFPNSGTEIDSQGTASVAINNTSTAGTGGLTVYQGGANSGTLAGYINGTGQLYAAGNSVIGSASGAGNLAIGNHLNQLATADYAGSCAMSSSTTCHVGFQHSYSAAVCFASDQTNPPHTAAQGAYYSGGDCYVTAQASNSDTWGCVCIGNPY